MAERRMFARAVVLAGPFIRLSAKAQLLYFHLGMQADDEGFISAPELAMRAAGAAKKDLQQLLTAEYLLRFDTGLLVIRHWFLHNNIKKDRFRPTVYQQELKKLILKDKVYELDPQWSQDGSMAEPQIKQNERKEKERKEEQRKEIKIKENDLKEKEISSPIEAWPGMNDGNSRIPTLKDVRIFCLENQIRADGMAFYDYYQERDWKIEGKLISDWRILLMNWEEDHAGTP